MDFPQTFSLFYVYTTNNVFHLKIKFCCNGMIGADESYAIPYKIFFIILSAFFRDFYKIYLGLPSEPSIVLRQLYLSVYSE